MRTALLIITLLIAPAAEAASLPVVAGTLPNGVRYVLAEDGASAAVSVVASVEVGSADEEEGHAGTALLAARVLGRSGGADQIIARGGTTGSDAGIDLTSFHVTLPAEALPLAIADLAAVFAERELSDAIIEAEREALLLDRRRTIARQRYGRAMMRVNELAYRTFPYGHDGLGDALQLLRRTPWDLRRFVARWYQTERLIVVVAGSFQAPAALALLHEHFGALEARPAGPRSEPVTQPPRGGEPELIYDALAEVPAFVESYSVCSPRHEDHLALELLAEVLAGSPGALLSGPMRRRGTPSVQVSLDHRRGPDLFNFFAVTLESPDKARLQLYRLLGEIESKGIGELQVERAKARLVGRWARQLEPLQARASLLARAVSFHGEVGRFLRYEKRVRALGEKELREVLRRYLRPSRRNTVDVLPEGQRRDHEQQTAALQPFGTQQ